MQEPTALLNASVTRSNYVLVLLQLCTQQKEIERLSSSVTDLLEEKKRLQAAAIAERKALKVLRLIPT